MIPPRATKEMEREPHMTELSKVLELEGFVNITLEQTSGIIWDNLDQCLSTCTECT